MVVHLAHLKGASWIQAIQACGYILRNIRTIKPKSWLVCRPARTRAVARGRGGLHGRQQLRRRGLHGLLAPRPAPLSLSDIFVLCACLIDVVSLFVVFVVLVVFVAFVVFVVSYF